MQETTGKADNGGGLDLLGYIELVAARRKMIMAVTAAAFVLSIAIALLLPKIYESTAKILPPQPDTGLMGLMLGESPGGGMGAAAGLASGLLGIGTPADMYASILQSDAIKDQIIDRFKLMDVYKQDYRVGMYDKLDKLVDIKAGKKDGIISITVEDNVPARAAEIANAYVEELEKLTVGLSTYGAGQNRVFYDQRLAKAKVDLAKAEEALKTFQEKNRAFQVPQQAEAAVTGIAQLRAQLAMQEIQLTTLRRTYTDSSQEVRNAQTAIAGLKSQIARLEQGGHDVIPGFGSVPALGQEYVRLMRAFKFQETLVEALTKQFELSKIGEANNVSTVQVIQKARVPDKKSRPKRARIVLLCTFLAFSCSTCSVIARYHYDNIPADTRERIRRVVRMVSPRLASWV